LKKVIKLMGFLIPFVFLVGCGPARLPLYEEILPNETAFVIPLEGASLSGQDKFDSVEFLQEKKVAAKRIYIPLKDSSTGRFWFQYKWIPTVRVIKVDRAPVTLVWEDGNAIKVESRDSIGFGVGTNITAMVKELDTARFLYYYPSGDLDTVLAKVVRSKSTELLGNKFAKYDLEGGTVTDPKTGKTTIVEGARQKKGEVVAETKRELTEYFAKTGVTISTFGLVGGLSYEDNEIQKAINDNFKSELEIKNKVNIRLAQEETNMNLIAIATAEKESAFQFKLAKDARSAQVRLEIERMNAEANLERAKRWDGGLPDDMLMLPADADPGFILDLKGKSAKAK